MESFDFKEIEQEISTQVAKLENPFVDGCGKVADVATTIDAFKDRVTDFYTMAIKHLNKCEQDLEDKKFVYKQAYNKILIDKTKLKEYGNQNQRDAFIETELIKQLTEVHEATKIVSTATTFVDYISRILKKLEKKTDALNTLLNAVKFGIHLGELTSTKVNTPRSFAIGDKED